MLSVALPAPAAALAAASSRANCSYSSGGMSSSMAAGPGAAGTELDGLATAGPHEDERYPHRVNEGAYGPSRA
jgi:hypothetical protein